MEEQSFKCWSKIQYCVILRRRDPLIKSTTICKHGKMIMRRRHKMPAMDYECSVMGTDGARSNKELGK